MRRRLRILCGAAALTLMALVTGGASADIVGGPPDVSSPPPNVSPAPPSVTPSPLFQSPDAVPTRRRTCRLYSETDKFGFVRIVRRCQ